MNIDFQSMLPEDFSPESRVWIYQCNRLFTLQEALQIEDILKAFVVSWNSHGVPVKGYANLFFGQFIVFIADETAAGVSGCSTDSSVRVVKDIEQYFHVNLFDRQLLAFLIKQKVQLIPLSQLTYAFTNNFISADTLYFNNTVLTMGQMKREWLQPVRESWLSKKMKLPA